MSPVLQRMIDMLASRGYETLLQPEKEPDLLLVRKAFMTGNIQRYVTKYISTFELEQIYDPRIIIFNTISEIDRDILNVQMVPTTEDHT